MAPQRHDKNFETAAFHFGLKPKRSSMIMLQMSEREKGRPWFEGTKETVRTYLWVGLRLHVWGRNCLHGVRQRRGPVARHVLTCAATDVDDIIIMNDVYQLVRPGARLYLRGRLSLLLLLMLLLSLSLSLGCTCEDATLITTTSGPGVRGIWSRV